VGKSAKNSAKKSTAKTVRKAKGKGRWKRVVTAPLAFLRGPIDKWRARKKKKPVLVADKKKKQQKKARKAGDLTTGQKAFRVARAVLVGLLICAVVFMFFETSLIFLGSKFPDGPWSTLQRVDGLEEVNLMTEDGVALHGVWVQVPEDTEARATILFFHGNAGNLAHRAGWLTWLREQRCNVFAVDYRGYGKSAGAANERGVYRDARAAWAWLEQRGVPAEELIVFGRSLGAAVALELVTAEDGPRPAAALVLESPFISVPEMSKEAIPLIPVRWLMATKMNNAARAPGLTLPLYVTHAIEDEMIPIAHGRAVYAAAHTAAAEGRRPHKEMFEMPQGGHNSAVWEDPEYQRRFLQFIDEVR
jgi:fermentation-respiration switch protein FrsA (DUF1100 family)